MKMIRFDEDDIRYLALELPDSVKYYHYSGDFAGEVREIDRELSRPLPEALRKRLMLERVIAEGMQEDYRMDADRMLALLKEKYPHVTRETLGRLIALGGVDYILRDEAYYFQNDAFANIRKTRGRLLEALDEAGNFTELLPEKSESQHKNAALMREKGGRAFRYTVTMSRSIRDAFVREGEEVTVHLPYPAICAEQPDTRLISSSHPVLISSSDHRTAAIRTPAQRGETYKVTFSFVNVARYHALDPERVSGEQPHFFTEEKWPQIRFTPFMRELAEELRGNETNPLLVARRIYNYITEQIHYSYMREYLYLANIPEFALLNRRGDCGVQALVFITLCRILGIPARWQSGCTVSEDGVGSHDWAQVYIAPYGWLPVDPSYGGGAWRRGDVEMRDYFFGNLDPFRMVTCNDVQVKFDPPKRFLRTDPYDNQRGEVEYRDEGLGFGTTWGERTVERVEDVTEAYFQEGVS